MASIQFTRLNFIELSFQYDAEVMGATGGGGTYTAQTGFGWSNGFVLTLLDLFGHELSLKDYDHFEPDKVGVVEDADVQQ